MHRNPGWRDLIPGALFLAAVVGSALAVLLFARPGELHGKRITLYASTGAARGVVAGNTEVWLAGLKVGRVSEVRFRPPSSDSARRLLLVLEVLDRYRPLLRRNSYAQIQAGGGLLGTPVVYIGVGTTTASELRAGDSLDMRTQLDIEGVTGQFAGAAQDFPTIIQGVKLLDQQLSGVRGTVGAFLNSDAATHQLDLATRRAGGLVHRATVGPGSVGLAMQDASLQRRIGRVLTRGDSLRAEISRRGSSIDRVRNDSLLLRDVVDLRDEAAVTRALLLEPRGTAGRVLVDSAGVRALDALQRQLDALLSDVRGHPFRYAPF